MNSAPSNPPNMKYLAIFCTSQFQNPQVGPYSPKNGGAMQVEKTFPGFQDTESLMFLTRNLLFRRHGYQVTNDFVWNSQTEHSFGSP